MSYGNSFANSITQPEIPKRPAGLGVLFWVAGGIMMSMPDR